MREMSKAALRRVADWRYANRWFVGKGVDIGCGPDPMRADDWPLVTEIVPHDRELGNGDASFMADVKDNEFDFVVSSHCLEHLSNPRAAIQNWIRIVRPGGFVVVTIPEELMYEAGKWPSRFNTDHKFPYSLRARPLIPNSQSVLHLLFKSGADVEHLTLLTEHWDISKYGQDQTLGPAECAIEFVLRKPDPQKPW